MEYAKYTEWIIEARTADGALDFTIPQPETAFGVRAITGIDEDAMAQVIFRKVPSAIMDGQHIADWPRLLNPGWSARRKTW